MRIELIFCLIHNSIKFITTNNSLVNKNASFQQNEHLPTKSEQV